MAAARRATPFTQAGWTSAKTGTLGAPAGARATRWRAGAARRPRSTPTTHSVDAAARRRQRAAVSHRLAAHRGPVALRRIGGAQPARLHAGRDLHRERCSPSGSAICSAPSCSRPRVGRIAGRSRRRPTMRRCSSPCARRRCSRSRSASASAATPGARADARLHAPPALRLGRDVSTNKLRGRRREERLDRAGHLAPAARPLPQPGLGRLRTARPGRRVAHLGQRAPGPRRRTPTTSAASTSSPCRARTVESAAPTTSARAGLAELQLGHARHRQHRAADARHRVRGRDGRRLLLPRHRKRRPVRARRSAA